MSQHYPTKRFLITAVQVLKEYLRTKSEENETAKNKQIINKVKYKKKERKAK